MAGSSTFTWQHALALHNSLSPFDSPLPQTHKAFNDVTPVSYKRLNIAGLLTTIYGLSELPARPEPVTCLFLLHGRGDTQDSMSYVAAAFLHHWATHRQPHQPHLICVTLDQRNHGSRMIDNQANVSWKQGNATHGPDMFSLYAGTAADVSLLITHLPAYLPFRVARFLACGVSLGGHATWLLLVNEPRVSAGIVVIGCPDYVRLMTDRAIRSKLASAVGSEPAGRNFVGSADFPPALVEAVERSDPAGVLMGELDVVTGEDYRDEPSREEVARIRPLLWERLAGKKVLCVSGGKDGLVPYAQGEPFIGWLRRAVAKKTGWAGDFGIEVEDFVDAEGRHEFSASMRVEAEKWLVDVLADQGVGGEQSKL